MGLRAGKAGAQSRAAVDDLACRDAPGDPASAKLEAHLNELDEPSLLRVARAVELARACDKRDPMDEQILNCLRPRLKELRPDRCPTFLRAICAHLEPFLFTGAMPDTKRQGWIPRAVLAGWWRVLAASPYRAPVLEAEAAYAAAMRAGQWAELADHATRGAKAAAEATAGLVEQAERSPGRRAEMLAILGSDRAILELRDIAAILAVADQITPALERVRQAAGVAGGRIDDFIPAAVLAARSAYVEFHTGPDGLVQYFFVGLLQTLSQPWQALRLIRVLSTDLSKAGEGHLAMIPTRLFEDLTRTLAEIGRATGSEQGMSRRVWLMTCARLVSDASAMIKGLTDEGGPADDPEWNRLLGEARARVNAAVESFAGIAVRDACHVLPVRQIRENGAEARLEPDMCHAPTEEEVQTAQAAALLFVACRRYAGQEGLDRAFRPKEEDLVHRLQIGINFRVEFLRARMRHRVCLAQLSAVAQALKMLPQTEMLAELGYRVERTIARYR